MGVVTDTKTDKKNVILMGALGQVLEDEYGVKFPKATSDLLKEELTRLFVQDNKLVEDFDAQVTDILLQLFEEYKEKVLGGGNVNE